MKKIALLLIFLLVFMTQISSVVMARTIWFGVLPLEQPETMFDRFNPLMEYLEQETGYDFELRLYPTRGKTGGYTSAVKGVLYGNTMFAYLASVTISQARHHDSNIEPVVCALRGKNPTYVGQVAVRKDSDIKTVEDLRGRRVIGSSRSSTSGNLMPSGMLIEKGIKKSEFAAMDYAGGHDKAALAVLAGDYDACWINDKNFQKFKNKGVGLRAVWVHPPVPEFPICTNLTHADKEVVAKVRAALLAMHVKAPDALKAIDKKYKKWVEIKWSDYQPIKNTIDNVYGAKFYNLDD